MRPRATLVAVGIGLLASLPMPAVVVDHARAQPRSPADAPKTIGTCVAIQTTVTTSETPLGLRAEGSCESPRGQTQSCIIDVVPTAADTVLDVTDNTAVPQCLALAGNDPCANVQNGPLIFQSQRHATQMFTVGFGSDPLRMTTMVRQKRVQQTIADSPPSARFPLNAGRLFDVLRNRSSAATRLECSMTDGDQRIFPIVGEMDLSPNLRFVSKNSAEPTFDILTYRVVP